MAQVARGTKSTGGTDFETGATIIHSEFNTDFDTLYNEFNGNIEDANVKSAAGIVGTKVAAVGGSTVSDAEYQATSDPGTFGTPQKPSNLEEEIQKLRYSLHTLLNGRKASTFWGTDVGYTLEGVGDDVGEHYQPHNLIRNGSFAQFGNDTSTLPDQWALVLTPATLAQETTTIDGMGSAVNIVTDAALEGIRQTIPTTDQIADGTYRVRCRARADTGVARVLVSGGASTLTLNTSSTGAYELLSGTLTADNPVAAITVDLLGVSNGDDVFFTGLEIVPEFATTNIPPQKVIAYQSGNTAGTAVTEAGGWQAWTISSTALDLSVVVPSPGFYIKVTAQLAGGWNASGGAHIAARLREDIDGGGASTVMEVKDVAGDETGGTIGVNMPLTYFLAAPVAGSEYNYTIEVNVGGQTSAIDFVPQEDYANVGAGTSYTNFLVECLPWSA